MIISKKAFISIFLIAALGLLFAALPSIQFLINFSHDDSFFYIKTAYNFSAGQGSTFDTINPTNGYHPLWFLILASYFFVINFFGSFSPEVNFRFLVLLQYTISILTLYFVYLSFSFFKEDYKKTFLIYLPLFLILVFTRDFGLESPLMCLLYSLLLYCKVKEVYLKRYLIFFKVVLINLIFLCRIDFLFTAIPAIIITDLITSEKSARKKIIISYILSLAISAGIYFFTNKILYGHFLTISASIKSSFPEILIFQNLSMLFQPGYLTNQLLKFTLTLFSVIIFIINFKYQSIVSNAGKIKLFLFGACAGGLIFLIQSLAFSHQGIREWYITFPVFASLLLVFGNFDLVKKNYYIKLGFAILLFAAYFYLTRIANSKWDSCYNYAIKLKENTVIEDRILQMDLSGIVGFFSERKIINGDGLINSFEYRDYVKSNSLGKYLKDKNVNYYSTHSKDSIAASETFTDSIYSNNFGGYPFTFPASGLVMKIPFYYDHVINKGNGEWYLFKIEN